MTRPFRFLPLLLLAALPSWAVLVTGPEIELTQPVAEPPAFSQWYGRIASDGRDYLAVWTESAGSTAAVHAARVSADGRRLDDVPLLVVDSEFNDQEPDVVWDGTRYLVVWSAGAIAHQPSQGIFGRFVERDGRMSEIFRVSRRFGEGIHPRVISNGRQFLVVWRNGSAVHGSLLHPAGHVLHDLQFPEEEWPGGVEVATANGDLFLVTSKPDYTPPLLDPGPRGDVGVTRISDDGFVAPRVKVVDATARVTELRTASRSNGAVIAWTSTLGQSRSIFSATLTALGAGGIRSFDAGSLRLEAVIPEPDDFLLVYGDDDERFARRVMGGGPRQIATLAPSGVMAGAMGPAGPLLLSWAAPPADYLTPLGWNLYVHELGGEAFEPLALAPRHQARPGIAASGALRLAAWAEVLDAGNRLGVVATRIDGEGRVLDPQGIDLGVTVTPLHVPAVVVAGSPGQWLIIWQSGSEVLGKRVAADGRILDAEPIAIAGAVPYPSRISAAWDGQRYVVAFTRGVTTRGGGSFSVIAARVSPAGVVDSPEITIAGAGPNYWPDLAAGPEGIMIVWINRPSTSLNYTVQGALLSRAGAVTPVGFPRPEWAAHGAAVAWNGRTFLVAAPYSVATHLFLVSATGVVTEPPSGSALPHAIPTIIHELEAQGDRFVLAWADEGTIHAATISGEGRIIDQPVPVATIDVSEQHFGLSGSTMVYARNTDPLRGRLTRVFVRDLAFVPVPPRRRGVRH